MKRFVLTITCPDRIGVVAAVTRFIAEHGGSIVEAAQHSDLTTGRFFQRIEIVADIDFQDFDQGFAHVAGPLDLDWRLTDVALRKRVVILVSREDHCIADLLYRWRSGDLACDIPLVISNHRDLGPLVESHGIDFVHLPVATNNKDSVMNEIVNRFRSVRGDVMVLARYMQIIPAEMCAQLSGQIINIHHSFLPSFAGARPYHQALERGVKLIGATCHYVTADLDAGPIIEQDISRIDHADSVEDLIRIGRDVERTVLARGLRWHLEDRVLLNGASTVVFA